MSAPMIPIDLVHTTLSFELAQIQWLIPEIVYTPENYTVVYGKEQTLLNYSSNVIVGTDNITSRNQIYSTTLSVLEPNTTYYYQVIATNSVGRNSSIIRQLLTPLPSEYSCHDFVCFNCESLHVATLCWTRPVNYSFV